KSAAADAHIIDLLMTRSRTFAAQAQDHDRRHAPITRPGAPEPTVGATTPSPSQESHCTTGEQTHATSRPHREARRYQACKRMELEAHPRKDRRLLAGAGGRRAARSDEADQTTSRQGRRVVRALAGRDGDAQRGADARRWSEHAAHR